MQHSGFENRSEREQLLPHWDFFRTWNCRIKGLPPETDVPLTVTIPVVAPDCDIIVVSWVPRTLSGFPRTLELMQAIDYVSRKGAALPWPPYCHHLSSATITAAMTGISV